MSRDTVKPEPQVGGGAKGIMLDGGSVCQASVMWHVINFCYDYISLVAAKLGGNIVCVLYRLIVFCHTLHTFFVVTA